MEHEPRIILVLPGDMVNSFIHSYTVCSIVHDSLLPWAFYLYPIPDPVYRKTDSKVVIQQIGAGGRIPDG